MVGRGRLSLDERYHAIQRTFWRYAGVQPDAKISRRNVVGEVIGGVVRSCPVLSGDGALSPIRGDHVASSGIARHAHLLAGADSPIANRHAAQEDCASFRKTCPFPTAVRLILMRGGCAKAVLEHFRPG